jgi:transposase
MTLHPIEQWTIPTETVKVARAAFPKGNVYMKMYEQLGQIYVDSDFQSLYPARCGQLALSPGRLALITVMQFSEGLSDRQAADAVRSRIDWKYVLGLELTDSGFDHSVLKEFRDRLIGKEKKGNC